MIPLRDHSSRALGLIVLAAALTGCGRANPDDALATDVVAVSAQPVRTTTLKETVTVSGTVLPTAAADIIVTATEPCAIAELPKQEGETVQAGEVVARLDIPAVATELATRQIEHTEAAARADTARAEAARLSALYDKGLAPRNQWDAARTALALAEANLGQALARLEAARQADARTVIHARFAGVVAKRYHNPGDLVTGLDSDPIIRIVDPGRLQVAAPVSTADSGRILPGQTAEVVSATGGTEPAIVALKLSPTAAGVTTTDVRLNFVAPTTLPFETPVQVNIVVSERPNALVVPAEAIQRTDGATFVWVPNENSQAVRREVRTGLIVNNLAQIVSGLNAGELVIVAGIAQLTEGVRVTMGR